MTERDYSQMTLRQLRSLQKAHAAVQASDAFADWREVLKAQAHGRMEPLMKPLTSSEKIYEQEFQKGEHQGLHIAMGMWQLLFDAIDQEIESRLDGLTPEQRAAEEAREE